MRESEPIKEGTGRHVENISTPSFFQDLRDLKEMAYREFQILMRYKTSFISGLMQIVLIYSMIIIGMAAFVGNSSDSSSTLEQFGGVVFYSMTIFLLMTSALWDVGNSMNEKQLTGVLESHFLAPTRYWILLFAPIISTLVWTLTASVLSFVVIYFTLGAIPFENVLLGVVVLTLTYGMIFGIATLVAAVAVHMKQGTYLLINFLQIGLMIACAMAFPFKVLPDWFLLVSRAIPLSYGVDLFRNVMIGHLNATELLPWEWEFAIVFVFGVLLPLVGTKLFSSSVKKAKEKGSLASF